MIRPLLPALALLALALGAPLATAQAQNFDAIPADGGNAVAKAPAAPAPAAQNGCQDDPRLEGDILAIMASDKPVSPPIVVTPETFINLDPEILTRLGGQMVICPNNPVLKGGKPMRKVVAPFEAIWDNLRKAAIAGDEARVKQVLTSYTAAPKPTQEIVNILTPVDLDDKVKAALYKAAGMALKDGGILIDFYIGLGGKPSDTRPVFIGKYQSTKPKLDENDESSNKLIVFSGAGDLYEKYGERLRRLGISAETRS